MAHLEASLLLGGLMRAKRMELGLSVEALIDKLPHKVTSSYIYQMETAGYIPAADLIAQIAAALEMNVPKTMEMALKIKKDKIVTKYQKALSKYLDSLNHKVELPK